MDNNFRVLRAEIFICRNAPNFFLILVKENERWGIEPIIDGQTYSRKYFDTKENAVKIFEELTASLLTLSDGFDKKEHEYYFADIKTVVPLLVLAFGKPSKTA